MGAAKRDQLKNAVVDLRKELNLNQTEFGRKLGVSAMAVSRWEAGTNPPPGKCMAKLAVLSGKPTTFWLFMGQLGLSKKDIKNFR